MRRQASSVRKYLVAEDSKKHNTRPWSARDLHTVGWRWTCTVKGRAERKYRPLNKGSTITGCMRCTMVRLRKLERVAPANDIVEMSLQERDEVPSPDKKGARKCHLNSRLRTTVAPLGRGMDEQYCSVWQDVVVKSNSREALVYEGKERAGMKHPSCVRLMKGYWRKWCVYKVRFYVVFF